MQKQEIKELKLMQLKLQKEFLEIKQEMIIKHYDERDSDDQSSDNGIVKKNEEYLMKLLEIATRKCVTPYSLAEPGARPVPRSNGAYACVIF